MQLVMRCLRTVVTGPYSHQKYMEGLMPFGTDGCLLIKESLGNCYLKEGSQHLCYCSLSDLLGQF